MNSYNENLQISVSSSLNNQEVALKKAASKLDATTFSLYYAQGNYISIYEKLEVEKNKYIFCQNVFNDIVVDSDISTNIVSSANQAKSLVATSTSNASVAAANVQLATNAIVKLASDIGSIFSIVNAADFGSDIYQQCQDAKDLMDETAYLAEVLSQLSMETSTFISEVSTKELATKVEASDAKVKNLLTVINAEFQKTNNLLNTFNEDLAKASTNEKKLEGKLEDSKVNFDATKDALKLTNQKLNLNLTVEEATKNKTIQYKVSFTTYKSPFLVKGNIDSGYPVDSYNIFLVKESKKNIFSISEAEGIIFKADTNQFIPIKANELQSDEISKIIEINTLKDTDGDSLKMGDNYVVFVLAVFSTDYKKRINNFDDYLTSASATFSLTYHLNAAELETINVINTPVSGTEEPVSLVEKIISGRVIDNNDLAERNKVKNQAVSQTLEFTVEGNTDYKVVSNGEIETATIEYRCAFLPDNSEIIKGLLTNQELNYIGEENKDSTALAELNIEKANLRMELEKVQKSNDEDTDVKKWFVSLDKSVSSKTLATLVEIQALLDGGEDNLPTVLKKLSVKNINMKISGTNMLQAISLTIQISLVNRSIALEEKKQKEDRLNLSFKPGFMFNALIAEKIPAGNYTIGKPVEGEPNKFKVDIAPETTDNFGNQLIPGNAYIPVILSLNNQTSDIRKQFTNIISDFKDTTPFTYKYQNSNTNQTK